MSDSRTYGVLRAQLFGVSRLLDEIDHSAGSWSDFFSRLREAESTAGLLEPGLREVILTHVQHAKRCAEDADAPNARHWLRKAEQSLP